MGAERDEGLQDFPNFPVWSGLVRLAGTWGRAMKSCPDSLFATYSNPQPGGKGTQTKSLLPVFHKRKRVKGGLP